MNDTKALIKKMKSTLLELLKDEEAKEKNIKKTTTNIPEVEYFLTLYKETENTTVKERLTRIKDESVRFKNNIIKKVKR